jgi:flagellar biosynthesis GTPase FlhF
LLDPQFLTLLRTKIDASTITEEILEGVDPIFERERFEVRQFEEITPCVVAIYKWVNALHNYGMEQRAIHQSQAEMEGTTKELKEYQQQNAELIQKTQERKAAIETRLKEFEEMEAQFANMEATSDVSKRRIETIDAVLRTNTDFETFQRENQADVNEIPARSLLFAAYLVYCGSYLEAKRNQFLEFVGKHLGATGRADLNRIITMRLAIGETLFANQPMTALVQGRHVFSLLRTPVIKDTDGYLRPYIESHSVRVIQTSMYSPHLEKNIAQAAADGLTLVVYDCNEMTPALESLLRACNNRAVIQKPKHILIGKTEVQFAPDFRLFLFTRTDFTHARVTRIDPTDTNNAYI